MAEISMIGMDIAKSVFQLHGTDAKGDCQLVRRLKRRQVLGFFRTQPPCGVALEVSTSEIPASNDGPAIDLSGLTNWPICENS